MQIVSTLFCSFFCNLQFVFFTTDPREIKNHYALGCISSFIYTTTRLNIIVAMSLVTWSWWQSICFLMEELRHVGIWIKK